MTTATEKIAYIEDHRKAVMRVGVQMMARLRDTDADLVEKALGLTPQRTTNILLALMFRLERHDEDKIKMLKAGLSPEITSRVHRSAVGHHQILEPDADMDALFENYPDTTWVSILEALIDFESAALTKPDKPLNAQATVNAHYADRPVTPYLNKVLTLLELDDPTINPNDRWE